VDRERDRALHAVLQLTHVPRPRVGEKALRRRRRESGYLLPGLRGVHVDEVLRQHQDVAAARAQRRQRHGDDVDAEVQVLAEALLLDGRLQIAVRGADEARVERHLGVAAHGADLALLQRAQQLRLQAEWQIADLVEEECAAARLDE